MDPTPEQYNEAVIRVGSLLRQAALFDTAAEVDLLAAINAVVLGPNPALDVQLLAKVVVSAVVMQHMEDTSDDGLRELAEHVHALLTATSNALRPEQ